MNTVVRVTDPAIRQAIEEASMKDTFPDVIKFIEDKEGNWITSAENLINTKFIASATIQTELVKAETIDYKGEKTAIAATGEAEVTK